MSHPVSGEHLSSVLVLNLDDSGRLDPRLPIHLDGNALITQDRDLHCPTLIQVERETCGSDMFDMCQPHIVFSVRVVTCAMRWCWSLMTLETAICMLPNTATTSRILSSNDGAQKICVVMTVYCERTEESQPDENTHVTLSAEAEPAGTLN